MAIVTLLGTSVLFYALGWTDAFGKVTVLTIGTVVCVAASIAGDISQDLKTGYLIGATPADSRPRSCSARSVNAWVIAGVVLLLGSQYGFGGDGVPRAPGDADEDGHRRRAAGQPALGAGAHRRVLRDRRRAARRPGAGLRRRDLPAAVHDDAGLRRRLPARARREARQAAGRLGGGHEQAHRARGAARPRA